MVKLILDGQGHLVTSLSLATGQTLPKSDIWGPSMTKTCHFSCIYIYKCTFKHSHYDEPFLIYIQQFTKCRDSFRVILLCPTCPSCTSLCWVFSVFPTSLLLAQLIQVDPFSCIPLFQLRVMHFLIAISTLFSVPRWPRLTLSCRYNHICPWVSFLAFIPYQWIIINMFVAILLMFCFYVEQPAPFIWPAVSAWWLNLRVLSLYLCCF
jgi:hypothetical protein